MAFSSKNSVNSALNKGQMYVSPDLAVLFIRLRRTCWLKHRFKSFRDLNIAEVVLYNYLKQVNQRFPTEQKTCPGQ